MADLLLAPLHRRLAGLPTETLQRVHALLDEGCSPDTGVELRWLRAQRARGALTEQQWTALYPSPRRATVDAVRRILDLRCPGWSGLPRPAPARVVPRGPVGKPYRDSFIDFVDDGQR